MKKLTDAEITELGVFERIELCTCDIKTLSDIEMDPNCPIHWSLVPEVA
jgi:hypothetical protein